MVGWQRRIPLGGRKVIGITAFGRPNFSFFPLAPGRPLLLASSLAVPERAMPNFALTAFSEVRRLLGALATFVPQRTYIPLRQEYAASVTWLADAV